MLWGLEGMDLKDCDELCRQESLDQSPARA